MSFEFTRIFYGLLSAGLFLLDVSNTGISGINFPFQAVTPPSAWGTLSAECDLLHILF